MLAEDATVFLGVGRNPLRFVVLLAEVTVDNFAFFQYEVVDVTDFCALRLESQLRNAAACLHCPSAAVQSMHSA